jgi:hypothetical protein
MAVWGKAVLAGKLAGCVFSVTGLEAQVCCKTNLAARK